VTWVSSAIVHNALLVHWLYRPGVGEQDAVVTHLISSYKISRVVVAVARLVWMLWLADK
jgi:hypothetical protein